MAEEKKEDIRERVLMENDYKKDFKIDFTLEQLNEPQNLTFKYNLKRKTFAKIYLWLLHRYYHLERPAFYSKDLEDFLGIHKINVNNYLKEYRSFKSLFTKKMGNKIRYVINKEIFKDDYINIAKKTLGLVQVDDE